MAKIAIEALAEMGVRGRTEKERNAIKAACKAVDDNISMSRLCERDFPMLMERAQEKLAAAKRMSVPPGLNSEADAVEFMKNLVATRAEANDAPDLENDIPDILQAFKPPCTEVLGVKELIHLQQRVDARADEYRLQRNRMREKLSTPKPTVFSPKIDRVIPGKVPEIQAYRAMSRTPLPKEPRPFVEPVVPPKLPEYGANYLRETRDELRRTKSEPELPKLYPRAPPSSMKVLALKEPTASATGQPIAHSRILPHLARRKSELPCREVETAVGLFTAPDSMLKQFQQARMVAAGRHCLRYHHHVMHAQPNEQAKAADTRRDNMKLVRTLKKEEYIRMHPESNPVSTSFLTMAPGSVLGQPTSYFDVFPPSEPSSAASSSHA